MSINAKRPLDGATLVTFGDSLTALSLWPMSTAETLNMHLVNAGIGANTTMHALARFDRDVAAHHPDFVTVCFGTNDCYRKSGPSPRVAPDVYRRNLCDILSRIEAIGAVPLLITPPFAAEYVIDEPSWYPQCSFNGGIDEYVGIMRDVAAEKQIGLVDIHAVCDAGETTEDFLVADGLHLSAYGSGVVTREIAAYMTTHFHQDPNAARIAQPTAPKAQAGAWTRSIVPMTADGWRAIYPDAADVRDGENGVEMFTKNGEFPEIHYSPLLPDTIAAPVKGTSLTIDLTLDAAANIILFFGGATPTLAYTDRAFSLTPFLKTADDTLQTAGYDLLGGQTVRCTLPLEDMIPQEFIAEDGTVLFSGVKVFVVGQDGQTVTLHEMSITTTG